MIREELFYKKIKKFLSIFLIMFIIFPIIPNWSFVKAEDSETIEQGCFKYLIKDGKAYIIGMAETHKSDKDITINKVMIDKGKIYDVEINNGAFKGNSFLKNVSIQQEISKIPDSCFSGCDNLETVKVVEKQGKLQTIGDNAFYGCKKLDLSFLNKCSNLQTIGNRAFYNAGTSIQTKSVVLNNISKIGKNAFKGANIYELEIKGNIESIDEGTFDSCPNLDKVILPNTVKDIGKNAFANINNYNSGEYIEIPRSVGQIGERAFYKSNLNVKIPSSVIKIAQDAFKDFDGKIICANDSYAESFVKNNLKVDENNKSSYTDFYFDNNIGFYLKSDEKGNRTAKVSLYTGELRLVNLKIPVNIWVKGYSYIITEISNNVFNETNNITSVEIPESVTSIGAGNFTKCKNLESVTILNMKLTIGEGCFKDCKSDFAIVVPDSATDSEMRALNDKIEGKISNPKIRISGTAIEPEKSENTQATNGNTSAQQTSNNGNNQQSSANSVQQNTSRSTADIENPKITNVNVKQGNEFVKEISCSFRISDNKAVNYYQIERDGVAIVKKDVNFKACNFSWNVKQNGIYKITAKDSSGNWGSYYFTINKIDVAKPYISNVVSNKNKNNWVDKYTMNFSISDNAGIKSVEIRRNGQQKVYSQTFDGSKKTVDIVCDATKNGTYKIYAYDINGLGGYIDQYDIRNIDDYKPDSKEFKIESINAETKNISCILKDTGLGVEKYIITKNKDDIKNTNNFKSLTNSVYNSNTKKFNYQINENGTYYLAFMDKNKNVSNIKRIEINTIDKDIPQIRDVKVIKNEGAYNKSNSSSNYIYYLKNNNKLQIKLVFTEKVKKIDTSKIKINGINASLNTVLSEDKKSCIVTITGGSGNTINKGTISIDSGFLTDEAGHVSTQNIAKLKSMAAKKETNIIEIGLDNSLPNINAVYDYNNSKITANITDASGISEYQWKIEEAGVIGKVKSGNKALKLEKILNLGKNNGKTVKLWVKDAVGNETTKIIVPPAQAKVNYVSRKDDIVTYRIIFNNPATIHNAMKNNLNNYQKPEDIKECTIENLVKDPDDTTNKKFLLTVNTHGSNQSAKIHIPKGTIYLYNENSSEETEINIEVDNVKPTISLGNLQNEKCQSFVLSFYTFDSSYIKKVQISRENEILRSESVKNNTNYTGSYKITKNGQYKITVWDKQGNKSVSEFTVNCIDNKNPILKDINYDTPDELGNVVVTITANEPIEANNWNNVNENTITKTYNESDLQGTKVNAEKIIIKDSANNKIELTLEDKIQPRVVGEIQKTTLTNGNTNIVINFSEEIQYTEELQNAGWILSKTQKQLTKEVSANEEIMVTDLAGNDIDESIKIEVEQTEKFFIGTECVPKDKVKPTTTFVKLISTSKDIKSVDLQGLTDKVSCEIINNNRTIKITYNQSVKTKEAIKVTDIDDVVHTIHINRLVNVVKKGDSNNDGKVDLSDYYNLVRNVIGTESETDIYKIFAMDINDDGKIDYKDLVLLSKLLG